jgi:hypothetical protein
VPVLPQGRNFVGRGHLLAGRLIELATGPRPPNEWIKKWACWRVDEKDDELAGDKPGNWPAKGLDIVDLFSVG